eukprot:57298_1
MKQHALRISLFVWQIIFFILCSIVFAAAIYFVASTDDPNKYKNKLNILSFIGLTSFWLTSLIGGVLKTYFATFDEPYSDGYDSCIIAGGICWTIGQTFIDLLFIHRINFSFKDTKYQSSKTVYTLFYIGVGLFFILLFGNYFFLFVWRFADPFFISGQKLNEVGSVSHLLICIVDLILTISFIYLFISKLMTVAVDSVENSNWNDNRNVLISLLNVMVKYMLLSIIALVISQLYILYMFIHQIINAVTNDGNVYTVMALCGNIIWPVDVFICSICIALYLPNSEALYEKLCHGCHSLCKLWFTRFAQTAIKKRKQKQTELQHHLLDPNNQHVTDELL